MSLQVFDEAPQGIQTAPHDCRIAAAGYQVAVREVDLGQAHDKDSLMLAFLGGLGLTQSFGRNWDALYDVLTDPQQFSGRTAVLLCDFEHFRQRHTRLSQELSGVLIDAQASNAETGRKLWLLAEEPDSAPL